MWMINIKYMTSIPFDTRKRSFWITGSEALLLIRCKHDIPRKNMDTILQGMWVSQNECMIRIVFNWGQCHLKVDAGIRMFT